MKQSNEHKTRIPGMMQIMGAVAKASKIAISTIMGNERHAGIIHARAAFYKMATEYGYAKSEIMWYLDRDRTVGYNYESNLAGHLSRNTQFKALCDDVDSELRDYTYRASASPQRQNMVCLATNFDNANIHDKKTAPAEPAFKPWKGKLGWSFTADECRREYYACRAATEYMRAYGQPTNNNLPRGLSKKSQPIEMTTMDAAIYLGISPALLTKGVEQGYLHRFKKPKERCYWFKTSELDNFRIYINQAKRGNK